MSVVRWYGLFPRLFRSADSLNGYADTFEGTGQVDSPNLAEEGLGRRSLRTGIVGEVEFEITEGTRAVILAATGSGTWTQWDPTGANPFRSGAIEIADGDSLLLQAIAQFSTEQGGQQGIGSNSTVRLRIAYNDGSTTGSGTVTLAEGTKDAGGAGAHARADGFLDTFIVLEGPMSLNWVELQYVTFRTDGIGGGVVVSPNKSTFYGIMYKRCS